MVGAQSAQKKKEAEEKGVLDRINKGLEDALKLIERGRGPSAALPKIILSGRKPGDKERAVKTVADSYEKYKVFGHGRITPDAATAVVELVMHLNEATTEKPPRKLVRMG